MAKVLVEHGEIVKLAQLLGVARKTVRAVSYTHPSPRDISGSRMPSSA